MSRSSKDEKIKYVDENGNPLDLTDVNTAELEFYDEYGRPTDQFGNILTIVAKESVAVTIAEKFLKAGKISELVQHCTEYTAHFPKNARLWSLLGMAYGSHGDGKAARNCYLSALLSDSTDPMVLTNYITSCFQAGDKTSATEAIKKFFPQLKRDCQKVVLESLVETIRTELVSGEDLPEEVRKILEQPTSRKRPPVEINFIEVPHIGGGHGYSIFLEDRRTAIAYIDGYSFKGRLSFKVEIVNRHSRLWLELDRKFETEFMRVHALVESLSLGEEPPFETEGHLRVTKSGLYMAGGF